MISESSLFVSAMQHLSRKGILAPEHVSLICDDPDRVFHWCDPMISHIGWDPDPVIRRVLQWADHVARGKEDMKQTFTKSEFVRGGTIGRPPR